jgi:hypothetical protein
MRSVPAPSPPSTKPPKHQDSCQHSPCQATIHHNSPYTLRSTPSVYRPIGSRHNTETIPHPAKKASGLHPFCNPCPSSSVQTSNTCVVPRETQRALGSSVKKTGGKLPGTSAYLEPGAESKGATDERSGNLVGTDRMRESCIICRLEIVGRAQ